MTKYNLVQLISAFEQLDYLRADVADCDSLTVVQSNEIGLLTQQLSNTRQQVDIHARLLIDMQAKEREYLAVQSRLTDMYTVSWKQKRKLSTWLKITVGVAAATVTSAIMLSPN